MGRIGIASECKDEPIEVVDMSAMLPSDQPTLTVNGGWFRRAAEMHGVNCDWEPVVLDAIVTDPSSKYAYIGRLDQPTTATVMKGDTNGRNLSRDEMSSRRALLKASPSQDELDINEEMSRGRKPDAFSRKLQKGKHRKILVHGYCSTESSFPSGHFTDAVQFTGAGSPSSWSNDEFARKIDEFADAKGIAGCGIIAHSQGGMAALHLYQNYWSCLDNATSGSRLIQSVGTPYQGTALAGTLAAIGDAFGVLCGYNYDLTETGAWYWLQSISLSARSKVYYSMSILDGLDPKCPRRWYSREKSWTVSWR